jgi:dTDP-4-dehydrorhamnose reductase
VLITGAAGQLGSALLQRAPADVEIRAYTRAELDIGDAHAVETAVQLTQPDCIINAAAYTAVDRAEDEPDAAYGINALGPAHLAQAARAVAGCRLLHISTDYVFDGRSQQPYQPQDPPNPLSSYGRSKLAGEQLVVKHLGTHALVLRTAWVYAARGRNFLLTMLRLMRERGAVRVVNDQHGTPTTADSIATALWRLARRPDLSGILHWTDNGRDTWYGFAQAIAEEALRAGLLPKPATVTPIATADYPTRAHRPANSALDCSASIAALELTPRPWKENLRTTLEEIAAGEGRTT